MKKKDLKIIKEIQAEAWGKYGDKLFVEREIAPSVKKIAKLALTKEAHLFTEAERGRIRASMETGEFDKTVREEDPKVAEKYEKYVEKRIKEEIDKGNLSKPDPKKVKQYERRTKKRNASSN